MMMVSMLFIIGLLRLLSVYFPVCDGSHYAATDSAKLSRVRKVAL
jgi:hypothetical protein